MSERSRAALCGFLRGLGILHGHLRGCPTADLLGQNWSATMDRKAEELRSDPVGYFKRARKENH